MVGRRDVTSRNEGRMQLNSAQRFRDRLNIGHDRGETGTSSVAIIVVELLALMQYFASRDRRQ